MFKRFKEAREENKPVSTRNLQVWALQAAQQYRENGYKFNASKSWVIEFKEEYRIRQRKVTRYIKPSEKKSVIDIEQIAKNFQKQCSAEIGKYNPKLVLNTDQIGCEYRANIQRTLDNKGSKSVEVYIGDLNKVTHSYSAMYTITASGNILPKVFICLQEPRGIFGPRVQKRIHDLELSYGNVSIICSASGKLSTALMDK